MNESTRRKGSLSAVASDDLHAANLARVGLGGEIFNLVDEEGEMLDVC